MRKIIFAIILIYLAGIIENSFLSHFLISQRELDLVLITFFALLFFQNWSFNKMLIIGTWTGLILDIFRYPIFGTGIITILILVLIYYSRHYWLMKKPKKILSLSLWFLVYNLLFCLLTALISYLLASFFHQPSNIISLGSFKSLGIQLIYNGAVATLIFFLIQQAKKLFRINV